VRRFGPKLYAPRRHETQAIWRAHDRSCSQRVILFTRLGDISLWRDRVIGTKRSICDRSLRLASLFVICLGPRRVPTKFALSLDSAWSENTAVRSKFVALLKFPLCGFFVQILFTLMVELLGQTRGQFVNCRCNKWLLVQHWAVMYRRFLMTNKKFHNNYCLLFYTAVLLR
jgi:hypothetical protein